MLRLVLHYLVRPTALLRRRCCMCSARSSSHYGFRVHPIVHDHRELHALGGQQSFIFQRCGIFGFTRALPHPGVWAVFTTGPAHAPCLHDA